MISEKKTVVNNILINYRISEVENPKSRILLLHGWRSSSDIFVGLINFLNENNYSVLVPDLPAFGKSEIPKNTFNNDYLKDSVMELVKKINFNPELILGHSNGGAIATKVILSNEFNLRKLVLVCSAGIRDQRSKRSMYKYFAKIVKPFFKPRFMQSARKSIYKMIGSSDYIESAYIQDSYKNIINEDISNEFKQIKIPTQIIWGENDKETPLYYAELLKEYIKNSKLDVIANTGHFPFLDKSGEFNKILIDFLKHE